MNYNFASRLLIAMLTVLVNSMGSVAATHRVTRALGAHQSTAADIDCDGYDESIVDACCDGAARPRSELSVISEDDWSRHGPRPLMVAGTLPDSQLHRFCDVLGIGHGCRIWRRRWWIVPAHVEVLGMRDGVDRFQCEGAWEDVQALVGDPRRSERPPVPAGTRPASQLYQSLDVLGLGHSRWTRRRRLVAVQLHALALAMGGEVSLGLHSSAALVIGRRMDRDRRARRFHLEVVLGRHEADDGTRHGEGLPALVGARPALQFYRSFEVLGLEHGCWTRRRRLVAAPPRARALATEGNSDLVPDRCNWYFPGSGDAPPASQLHQPFDAPSPGRGCGTWRRRWWRILLNAAASHGDGGGDHCTTRGMAEPTVDSKRRPPADGGRADLCELAAVPTRSNFIHDGRNGDGVDYGLRNRWRRHDTWRSTVNQLAPLVGVIFLIRSLAVSSWANGTKRQSGRRRRGRRNRAPVKPRLPRRGKGIKPRIRWICGLSVCGAVLARHCMCIMSSPCYAESIREKPADRPPHMAAYDVRPTAGGRDAGEHLGGRKWDMGGPGWDDRTGDEPMVSGISETPMNWPSGDGGTQGTMGTDRGPLHDSRLSGGCGKAKIGSHAHGRAGAPAEAARPASNARPSLTTIAGFLGGACYTTAWRETYLRDLASVDAQPPDVGAGTSTYGSIRVVHAARWVGRSRKPWARGASRRGEAGRSSALCVGPQPGCIYRIRGGRLGAEFDANRAWTVAGTPALHGITCLFLGADSVVHHWTQTPPQSLPTGRGQVNPEEEYFDDPSDDRDRDVKDRVGCRMQDADSGRSTGRPDHLPLDPLPSGPFRPAVMVTVVVMDPRRWRALATATQPRREEGK